MLTLEPANVFLLLLNLDVVRDHVGELSVNTTLLKVTLQESLQVLIQVLEWRASVEALSSPVLLSSLGVGKVGLLEVRNLLDLEETVLRDGLDQKGTVAGLLDGDVDTGREAGLDVALQGVHLTVGGSDAVLGMLRDVTRAALVGSLVATLIVQLVTKSVVELFLLGQVLEVGDGEGEADPVQGGVLLRVGYLPRKGKKELTPRC